MKYFTFLFISHSDITTEDVISWRTEGLKESHEKIKGLYLFTYLDYNISAKKICLIEVLVASGFDILSFILI